MKFKENIKKILSNDAGFTMMEMIVALAVFSIIIVSMTSITFSIIKAQRKSFALQNSQEVSRYILESMNKEIRMSLINSDSGSGVTVLNITNANSETFDYQFDNSNKRLLRNGQVVSPDNIELTGSFYITKDTFPYQVIVTIVMKVDSTKSKIEQKAEINLQSTISSRL
ncbi:type II secretion system GspH family protein [Patescibacteria group bacterium]|nr:type II secretion system GspH family protein [Patescibacteria group bacterium]